MQRLGAKEAAALDLLSDPALQSAVESGDDDDAGELAEAVLAIAAHITDPGQLPAWLGLIPLPDSGGGLRSADELLLPDAPLATVLIAESPFGTVDAGLVERFVTDWAGPTARIRSIALKLGVPWYAYDTLTLTGTVVALDGREATIDVVGKDGLGDHITAKVVLTLGDDA